jgi:hypothetical protein
MQNKLERPVFNMMEEITKKVVVDLNFQFDNMIIEGLKRKGFEFLNKFQCEDFIRKRCKICEDEKSKERVFYVDDTPFLVEINSYKLPLVEEKDGNFKVTASEIYKYL